MNDFITKPYDEQDFFRKIEHVLSLSYDILQVENTDEANPVQADGSALYDLAKLEKMSRGNAAFTQKMISIFVELAHENTARLEEAVANDDLDTIRKIAHKIKPSIDQMGIDSLKDTVRKLEKCELTPGGKQEINKLVGRVAGVLKTVVKELGEKSSLS